jgi:hypothetical protein
MSAAKSVDPAVYEAYLQGRYWGGKFRQEDLLKAKGYSSAPWRSTRRSRRPGRIWPMS